MFRISISPRLLNSVTLEDTVYFLKKVICDQGKIDAKLSSKIVIYVFYIENLLITEEKELLFKEREKKSVNLS